ncbi:hypothetical protein JXA48_03930 [Candidatus Woesearchaeota archaeon]|nr:hypothetical protein [Candidatus Woesearchaeota archaeon]
MKYTLSLKTECVKEAETEKLLKLFAPEDKELSNSRAKYSIEKNNLDLIFKVEAQDAVALRAVLTSITKTLDIYEQIKKLI